MANQPSVKIELDQASFNNLQKQFDNLRIGGSGSAYRAMMKVAFKIKSEAQLRLTGRGHIVTSRLKNSIFVKAKKMADVLIGDNQLTYSDIPGNTYKSDLSTVSVSDLEVAIGTNVEYAEKIELLDSYLYWAVKNVNVMQSVAKDMTDDLKFGKMLSKNK